MITNEEITRIEICRKYNMKLLRILYTLLELDSDSHDIFLLDTVTNHDPALMTSAVHLFEDLGMIKFNKTNGQISLVKDNKIVRYLINSDFVDDLSEIVFDDDTMDKENDVPDDSLDAVRFFIGAMIEAAAARKAHPNNNIPKIIKEMMEE